ncbi:hypothetical protein F5X99DRAFT_404058 [Biscogniauxia marginata]|nr:hypothetical protein F5X99DRAFT_404058 [Biscogniauxia marginata]
MSVGGTGGRQLYGMSGASAAQQSVDLAENFDRDARESETGYGSQKKNSESQDKSFLASVKEALKPGDVKRRAAHEDTTQEGKHGGIMEALKPGIRDDDENQKHRKRGEFLNASKPDSGEGEGQRGAKSDESGLLQSMMPLGHKEHSNKESHSSTTLDSLKPGDSRRDDVEVSHHEHGSMLDFMSPGHSTPIVPGAFKSSTGGSDPGSIGQQRRTRSGSDSRIGSSIKEKLGLDKGSERNY